MFRWVVTTLTLQKKQGTYKKNSSIYLELKKYTWEYNTLRKISGVGFRKPFFDARVFWYIVYNLKKGS